MIEAIFIIPQFRPRSDNKSLTAIRSASRRQTEPAAAIYECGRAFSGDVNLNWSYEVLRRKCIYCFKATIVNDGQGQSDTTSGPGNANKSGGTV